MIGEYIGFVPPNAIELKSFTQCQGTEPCRIDVIYETRKTTVSNTEKRVENRMHGGVFLKDLDMWSS